MTRRLALFWYHRDPEVCANHVELLRQFNPMVPIHGLRGGPCAELQLETRYTLKQPNWQNGDLALREWFAAVGCQLDFDVLHVIEWDLLLFAPLEALFGHVPSEAVGLAGAEPLTRVEDSWYWTTRPDWTELRRLYPKTQLPVRVGHLGAAVLPRRLLELPEWLPLLSNGEARVSLAAALHGVPVVDTGVEPLWDHDPFFRVNTKESLSRADILFELARPGGRRVFHPYSQAW